MASLIETPSATDFAGATLNLTWNIAAAFTTGSFVTFCHDADPGAYTAPSGWLQAGGTIPSALGLNGQAYVSLWYKPSSADGTDTWSWANSLAVTAAAGSRWSFVKQTSPLDQNGNATGGNSSPATPSKTTTSAVELLVAAFGQITTGGTAIVFSAPTNGFNIDVQKEGVTGGTIRSAAGLVERIVTGTGTYSTAVTSTVSDQWVAIFATFLVTDAGVFPVPKVFVMTPDDATNYLEDL